MFHERTTLEMCLSGNLVKAYDDACRGLWSCLKKERTASTSDALDTRKSKCKPHWACMNTDFSIVTTSNSRALSRLAVTITMRGWLGADLGAVKPELAEYTAGTARPVMLSSSSSRGEGEWSIVHCVDDGASTRRVDPIRLCACIVPFRLQMF